MTNMLLVQKLIRLKKRLGLDESLAPGPAVQAAQKMLGVKAQS